MFAGTVLKDDLCWAALRHPYAWDRRRWGSAPAVRARRRGHGDHPVPGQRLVRRTWSAANWCVRAACPRVEVIATALAQRLRGHGHRRIGQQLGVPAGTVRGWLRRVARRAERLRGVATRHLYGPDPAQAPPEPVTLGDALKRALAAAVQIAARHRAGAAHPAWGALLGQPAARPGPAG